MNKTFLDIQKEHARENFNYFFMKLISKTLNYLLKITLFLLVTEIFDYTIISIFCFIYVIYSIYSMYNVYSNYNSIMKDIKESIDGDEIYYEIDFHQLKNNLLGKEVNYGK